MFKVTIIEDQGQYMVGVESEEMMGGEMGPMGGGGMSSTEGGETGEMDGMTPVGSLHEALQMARQMFVENSGGEDEQTMRQEESDRVFNSNPKPAGYQA